ncbi:flagellar hook capping FlgD N-terminal domain-containing protein [Pseudoxanthomonas suwonensis]|jgi:flagellar basal-body rod modification protein FlgD|uniref:flagellar hook capping FlgD N-terminal domain-containing protein n=1 Tax=Pseudoxanthomonas suwonensis TaxID=314722 RepID=UPI00138F0CF1|nr:flagellar hook capping FlgD N-terminal domain-containing protein [Pseudoxanthomonas suwonensis]KAF1698806.1 flagellar basal body rod modification protein [Pseudoxanthomonas suwonensis]
MSAIASDIYSSLGLAPAGTNSSSGSGDALGQADFLRLMTEQLKHQDPLNPMENSAFLGQMAQFSTVQGIETLNTQVRNFSAALGSDQILRGAALVGHDVLVPSAKLSLGAEGEPTGAVAAPDAGSVQFTVTDANGRTVREFSVPASKAGEVAFAWDGNDHTGQRLPAGSYGISAKFTANDGSTRSLDTYVRGKVDSVTVGSDGLFLDLPGLGTVPLEYVLRVS